MKKFSSVDEFLGFRDRILAEKEAEIGKPVIVVSADTGAQASGVNDIIRMLKRYIVENSLQTRVSLRITGCHGFCEMNPYVLVEPGGFFYPKLTMEDVPRVVQSAINGIVDEGLIYHDVRDHKNYPRQQDIPFFKKQMRLILSNNQKLDPIRIVDYIENGGYSALAKAAAKSDPEWIIGEVEASGLRGRGGAGFPTGKKWRLARAAGNGSGEKFIVCNADEGDPGAYMDRGVLEGNPHSIMEGLIIGGIAIGAKQGIIYVRAEYPLAIKHTLIAIRQAREMGLLGKNILGAGIDFDIDIVRGAGAFVCGDRKSVV